MWLSDLLYDLGLHASPWLTAFLIAVFALTGFALAAVIGSVRFWYVKRTRLPQLWTEERAELMGEIRRLTAALKKAQDENNRLKTAAYGQVITVFRSATRDAM
jgi:hypothetical protein